MSYLKTAFNFFFFINFLLAASAVSAQTPDQVVLSSPQDDAEDVSVQPTLEWDTASGAISYELMLSEDDDFSDPVIDETGISGTDFEITEDLDLDTEYFWRVRGVNDDGEGDWSEPFSFSTEEDIPDAPDQVVLSSPSDGAEDIPLQPTFDWGAADRADSYELMLLESSDFSSPVIDESGITGTDFDITEDLDFNTEYFWRVRGVNDGGEGEWSNPFSFTTEEDIPDAPDQVVLSSPADGAEDIPLQPTLDWGAADRADSYELMLSESSDFSDPVIGETGIIGTDFSITEDLDFDTEYFWRVRGVNDGGEGDWSNSFSFTTDEDIPDAPGQVVLSSPADGAEDIPLQPTLGWGAADRADSYELMLSESSDFSDPVIDETGITGTDFSITEDLDFDTEYFWRVRGVNDGGEGEWSNSFSFTTEEDIPDAPDQVVLSSPSDGAEDIPLQPTLGWGAASGATSYELMLSESNDFSNPVINESGITGTDFSITEDLDFDTEYFWRVRGVNDGGEGDWSEPFSFTTEEDIPNAPDQVVLSSPADGAEDIPLQPVLDWDAADRADGYDLMLSESNDFSSSVINESGITGTDFSITEDLNFNTEYFWRVRGTNQGGEGDWSNPFSFTTEEDIPDIPGQVVLSSPADGAEDVSLQPTLDWNPAARADSYELDVSTNPNFNGQNTSRETGITGTDFTVTEELGFETEHYWRVRGVNESGEGEWSETFDFTTIEEAPDAPGEVVLSSPGNGEDDIILQPVLEWNSAQRAEDYELMLSENEDFSDPVTDETGISGTEYNITENLDFGTEYFWRVRAVNEGGEGDWSNPFRFTTIFDVPDAPDQVVLSSPSNGSEDIPLQPVLDWNTADRADRYELEVSISSDFEEQSVIEETDLTGTAYDISEDLEFETVFFWRVRGVNDGGEGAWSETFTFTTEENIPDAPGQVVLSSPENGAEDVPLQPVLEWNSASRADSFELVIATNPGFDGAEDIAETEITGTVIEMMETLDAETEYFWRVRGVNEGGEGEWSEVWSFRTENLPAPENLVLSEPDGGQALVLSWDEPGGAAITGFRIYRGSSVRQLELRETVDGETLQYTETELLQGASFYTVTALNGDEESEFSNLGSYYNDLATVPGQWTLGSIPLTGRQIEPGSSQIFSFEGVYREASALAPANGYWIKSSGEDSYPVRGGGLQQAELNLQKGWNLVGALADSFAVAGVVDSSGILTNTPVFGYNGQEYQPADTLLAGRGYWIHASEEGQVHLDLWNGMGSGQSQEKSVNEPVEGLAEISFRAGQAEQVVRAVDIPLDQSEKNRYLLPPKPPDPFLDVRTVDGFSVTDRPSTGIKLTASRYPVQVELTGAGEGAGYVYRIIASENDQQKFIDLLPGQSRTIDREYEQLTLTRIDAEDVILATAIEPNYPNPFNPVTTIEYRLTEFTPVRLQVFDLLGRLVATLINESQQPGLHRVQFDGSDKASGLYLLRIQAGEYTDVQKLTLIK